MVFDGQQGRPEPIAVPRGVRVLYSAPDQRVDELMTTLVRTEHPNRPVVVVTANARMIDNNDRPRASYVLLSALATWLEEIPVGPLITTPACRRATTKPALRPQHPASAELSTSPSRASRHLRLRSPRDSAVASFTDVLLDSRDTRPDRPHQEDVSTSRTDTLNALLADSDF
jgi:hypothetical protein